MGLEMVWVGTSAGGRARGVDWARTAAGGCADAGFPSSLHRRSDRVSEDRCGQDPRAGWYAFPHAARVDGVGARDPAALERLAPRLARRVLALARRSRGDAARADGRHPAP